MIENGGCEGNTCPPSPSQSPLSLAPIVLQISGIPKYEPTPSLGATSHFSPYFFLEERREAKRTERMQ